jgi:hypothetical protein
MDIINIIPSRLPSELNEGLSDQEKRERREAESGPKRAMNNW